MAYSLKMRAVSYVLGTSSSVLSLGALTANFSQEPLQESPPAIVNQEIGAMPIRPLPNTVSYAIEAVPSIATITQQPVHAPQMQADRPTTGPSLEERLFEFIKDSEGKHNKIYACTSKKRTIGVGFSLDAVGNKAQFCRALSVDAEYLQNVLEGRQALTDGQVKQLFADSVQEARDFVDRKFKGVELQDHQYIALVSLAFNRPALIGPNLTRQVRNGDWSAATYEIMHKSNRTQHKGIQNRRNREAVMFAGVETLAAAENFAAAAHASNFGGGSFKMTDYLTEQAVRSGRTRAA